MATIRLGWSTPPTLSMASDRFPCGRGRPPCGAAPPSSHLAGQEGFEPPTRGFGDRCSTVRATGLTRCAQAHFASLCSTCLRHRGQYLERVSLSCVFFLFFVVV